MVWRVRTEVWPVAMGIVFGLSAAGAASAEKAGRQDAERRAAPTARAYERPTSSALGTLPPGVGIRPGERAPDAQLQDAAGRPVRLAEVLKAGPVLLVFYRGGWCPYCNFQIRELAVAYKEYRRRGVTPVAISVDRPLESGRTVASYEIPFPVLSDPDLHAHDAYRVTHEVDADEHARLTAFGIDLEQASGRSHHVIAVPATFLIDARGVVRWAHADENYRVRPFTEQLLGVIDGLKLTDH